MHDARTAGTARVVMPAPRRAAVRLGAVAAGALALAAASAAHAAAPAFTAAPGSPIAVGTRPAAVVFGDLNADGRRDAVVANSNGTTLSVLLGLGTGGFGSPSAIDLGSNARPSDLALGDLNGDGRPDLAVTSQQSGRLWILLGNGSGGVTVGTPTNLSDATSVTIANVNGGSPDLLVTRGPNGNVNGTVAVLSGNGAGAFTALAPVTAARQPSDLAATDLNADGHVDIAFTNAGSNTVSVAIGNGSGGFASPNSTSTGANSAPAAIAAGDLNGDGKADLAIANNGADTASVLLGNGSGGLGAAPGSPVGVGDAPADVAIADFNADAIPDLAVANSASNTVGVLPGAGGGAFGTAVTVATGAGTAPAALAVDDLNGDAQPDLGVANSSSNTLGVYLSAVVPVTISLAVNTPSLDFGVLDIGATSATQTASLSVTTNDAAGYTLSVTRTTFSGGDIPVALTPGSVTTGAQFDVAGSTAVPTSGSLSIGRRLAATAAGGDTWQFGLALGPVPFVQDGEHSATLTFTALGL